MSTPDFFRSRLDQMIDLRHPLAVLATRLPWAAIEAAVAPKLARQARPTRRVSGEDLAGAYDGEFGGGISPAGRPRLPIRLMVSLLYLKNCFNLSDEELVERWAENVQWQFFSGMAYYEPRLPCDATQIGRFRRLLGEDGIEQLLKATIDCAVDIKAVKPAELERVIVDSTVQEKAIAHPVDSRLLEIARHKVVAAARRCGIACKQTYAKEGKTLRRTAGGYAHARQFKRLRKAVKRQRTILGVVMREVQRKLDTAATAVAAGAAPAHEASSASSAKPLGALTTLLQRAERIRTQQRTTKNKLYALHAPEVECISKGKAKNPYEFGVKVSLVVTHKQGLMVGARSFPGNPYDGHVLSAQLEQTANLLQDTGRAPKQVVVDLGYRGVDADNPGVQIIHRGKYKSLNRHEKRLLKRRQAIEPLIGHAKADHRMDRCWLQGAVGDALHALTCAAGYNIRWLLRAIARLGLKGLFCAFSRPIFQAPDRLRAIPGVAHDLGSACIGTHATKQREAGAQLHVSYGGRVKFAGLTVYRGRLTLAAEVLFEARGVLATWPPGSVSRAPVHRGAGRLVEAAFLAYEDGLWSEAYAAAAGRADAGDPRAAKLALLMLRHGARLYGVGFEAEPRRIARWAQAVLQATADARQVDARLALQGAASRGRAPAQRDPCSTSPRTASPSSITAIA